MTEILKIQIPLRKTSISLNYVVCQVILYQFQVSFIHDSFKIPLEDNFYLDGFCYIYEGFFSLSR